MIRSPRNLRRTAIVLAVALLALVAAACTDKGNPKGSLDVFRVDSSNRVVAEGWAFDPETPGNVLIEIREGDTVIASERTGDPLRPDVVAAYPGQTTADVGFAITTDPLGRGVHQICVWAVNRGVGTGDTQLGCRSVAIDAYRFALLGDSLAVGVDSYLRSRVTTSWPGSTVQTRAQVSAPISYAVDGIVLYKDSTDVLVVSAGANNLLSSNLATTLTNALDASAGSDCVVWPTVSERIYQDPSYPPAFGTPAQWKAGAQTFNATLRSAATTRPWIHVADWAPIVNANTSYTQTDGLHHTGAGNNAFADLLVSTVAANC